jgi:hypothetical protein
MTELCIACDDAPPFVPGMSLCRACLKAKVDADRAQRDARRQASANRIRDEKARRVWNRPL